MVSSVLKCCAGVARERGSSEETIVRALDRRMELVLAAAVIEEVRGLVLGAWGCGVFRNDPATVAGLFARYLVGPGSFAGAFERITFAVLDRHGATIEPFIATFARPGRS